MDTGKIAKGYYAADIESVYRCYAAPENCKGGEVGQTCNAGRASTDNIVCDACNDDHTPGEKGVCTECGGTDLGPFFAVAIIALICIVGLYHVIDTQDRVMQS